MPTEVKGAVNLRKALKEFTPDLAKETQKEIGNLLKPVTAKARGFIPSQSPLSGWADGTQKGVWSARAWSGAAAKRGVGYKTTPSKPNRSGFRALARIVNASVAGAIYETAGRVNPSGRPQATGGDGLVYRTSGSDYAGAAFQLNYNVPNVNKKGKSASRNPMAGQQFIDAMNRYSQVVDANDQRGSGRRSRKMKGRAIFRAWKEDGGKTTAAVVKAIENSKVKFYAQTGIK